MEWFSLTSQPTQPEIDALSAFSHRWLVQEHIDAGRALEAVLALHYPPEIFAEYDKQIMAAFALGYALASTA